MTSHISMLVLSLAIIGSLAGGSTAQPELNDKEQRARLQAEPLFRIQKVNRKYESPQISSNGRIAIRQSGNDDEGKTFDFFDTESGKLVHSVSRAGYQSPWCVDVSIDSGVAIFYGFKADSKPGVVSTATIDLIDMRNGKTVHSFGVLIDAKTLMSSDGKWLIYSPKAYGKNPDFNQSLAVAVDTQTGETIATYPLRYSDCIVALSTDKSLVCSYSGEIFDAKTGARICRIVPRQRERGEKMTFAEKDTQIRQLDERILKSWDTKTGDRLSEAPIQFQSNPQRHPGTFSADGSRYLLLLGNGIAQYDADTGELSGTWMPILEKGQSVSGLSADGTRCLITRDLPDQLEVWVITIPN